MRNNILDGCSIEHLCHPRILPQNNKKITKSKYKRDKTLANDLDLKNGIIIIIIIIIMDKAIPNLLPL